MNELITSLNGISWPGAIFGAVVALAIASVYIVFIWRNS